MHEQHSYGWQPSPPDFRDRAYAPPARLANQALPPFVDLRATCPPVYDQGQLGACGPNAAAGLIQFDEMAEDLADKSAPSRLFIYYNTRVLMGTVQQDSGVNNRTLLKALAQSGYCPESLWPYSTGSFRTQPAAPCYAQAKRELISDYAAVAQDLNMMRACLAAGRPFIFGFTVYESLETPAVAATGIVPLPRPSERVLGGHDVLIAGYDDVRQQFLFRNSWGERWGAAGYGQMPYAYATSPQLATDFWTISTVPNPDPVPPGPPVPPPPPLNGIVLTTGTYTAAVVAGKKTLIFNG